jgi:hypothetical protein
VVRPELLDDPGVAVLSVAHGPSSAIGCDSVLNQLNVARVPDSGVGGFGGGIYADNAPLMLTNVTISGNTAGHGGGVYAYVLPTTFHNSIVSGNSRNCSASGGGTIVSAGHNLEKGTTCHFNRDGRPEHACRPGLAEEQRWVRGHDDAPAGQRRDQPCRERWLSPFVVRAPG